MPDRLLQRKIESYSIEQLVSLIRFTGYKEPKLLLIIDDFSINNDEKEQLSIKVKRAFNRFNEPLESNLKIFYLIFPFGIINAIAPSYDSDLKRFKEFGYFRKEVTLIRYSLIGVALYLTIGLLIGLALKNNWI